MSRGRGRGQALAAVLVCVAAVVATARAELAAETPGGVQRLGTPRAHWVWVGDVILERVQLVDLDASAYLGEIHAGYGMSQPLASRKRPEVYVPATYYSRRVRGDRTDVFGIHDARTLAPIAEVPLPPHRAIDNFALAHATLTDDERFAAIFNWTPATSLSIVLRDDGTLDAAARTEPFFEPIDDPITEKAVRIGDRWIFVSFAGRVYEVRASADGVAIDEPWLLDTAPAEGVAWRIGGIQHLAIHAESKRLFVLMHHGGPDTHKDPGEEVWVYDLDARKRERRIPLYAPGFTIMGERADVWRDWIWPFGSLTGWLVDRMMPPIVTQIAVTRGSEPLLVTASRFTGGLGIYDATTGAFLRRAQPVGWTLDVITAPYGGGV
jgi:methylamine dehydrogenase heavy chain